MLKSDNALCETKAEIFFPIAGEACLNYMKETEDH